MSLEFWEHARFFLRYSGDKELIFASLDPDPIKYFKKEFGLYNWATLNADISSDMYWDFLNDAPSESPADSILANNQVFVITVRSRKWAIWGERDSGICAFASDHGEFSPGWNGIDWIKMLHSNKEWSHFALNIADNFKKENL